MDAAQPRPLVALCSISGGNPRLEYMIAVIESLYGRSDDDPTPTVTSWIAIPNGGYLDIGRNKAVWQWLDVNDTRRAEGDPPNDYLMFVDDDTGFEPWQIDALVDAAELYYIQHGVRPVIGGAYLGTSAEGSFAVAYRIKPDSDDSTMVDLTQAEVEAHTGPIEVDGVGTGFMLIHRDIIDNFEAHYPRPMVWFQDVVSSLGDGKNPGWFGEDLFFCLRAKQLGHPTLLHCGVRLRHYKVQGLVFNPVSEES